MNSTGNELFTKIALTTIFILLIIGSIYYFFFKDSRLSQAQKKVQIETSKLENLNEVSLKEREVISNIKQQYNLLRRNVVRNSDFLFNNVDSDNPQIILKITDKKKEGYINKKRREITKLFEAWDKIINDLESGKKLDKDISLQDLMNQIKNDLKYVKEYTSELRDIVKESASNYEGSEQNQIVGYEILIDNTVEQINQITENIQEIEEYIPTIYNTETTTGNNNGTTQTNNPTPPIITQTQIQTQEELLQQAIELLQQLQNNLQNQNGTTTPVTQSTTTPEINPTPQPGLGAQTMMEYLRSLPAPIIDKTGWPDISHEDTAKPFVNN